MRLASNPHVCCLFLLSTKSPASTLSTRYIEISRGNGQHGQHAKNPSMPIADSCAPEHLSLPCAQILPKGDEFGIGPLTGPQLGAANALPRVRVALAVGASHLRKRKITCSSSLRFAVNSLPTSRPPCESTQPSPSAFA